MPQLRPGAAKKNIYIYIFFRKYSVWRHTMLNLIFQLKEIMRKNKQKHRKS